MKKKTFIVTRTDNGRPISAFLKKQLGMRWSDIRHVIRNGGVQLNGTNCIDPSKNLQKGQKVTVDLSVSKETKQSHEKPKNRRSPQNQRLDQPTIRYVDKHIIIVDKPAGMTTVRHKHEVAEHDERARNFLPPTLADVLPGMLAKEDPTKKRERVRAVHRLDKDTSGLVVFAKTAEAERKLGLQMRKHTIERKYLALVRGQAKAEQIISTLVRDRGDGRRGSTEHNAPDGKRAVTNVAIVEELGEFTLVECRLETGRTHQVRIHLGEQGTPLCGERIYDRPLDGYPVRDTSEANRTMLHACFLSIEHPENGKRMKWSSSLPTDMKVVLQNLRKAARRPAPSDQPQEENQTRGKLSERFGSSE